MKPRIVLVDNYDRDPGAASRDVLELHLEPVLEAAVLELVLAHLA